MSVPSQDAYLVANLDLNQTVITSLVMTTWIARLAPAKQIDWHALGRTVELSIIEAFQNDEPFTQSTNLRFQCAHASRVLRLIATRVSLTPSLDEFSARIRRR
jgi:hypothetical protein